MAKADRVYNTPPINTPVVDTTRRRFLAVAAFASVAGAGSLAAAAMAPNVPAAVTIPLAPGDCRTYGPARPGVWPDRSTPKGLTQVFNLLATSSDEDGHLLSLGRPLVSTVSARGVVSGKLRRSLDDSAGLMAMAVGAIGIDCGRMTGLNRPAAGS
jgi:hypothetical protein